MAGRTLIIASHAVESLAPIADQAIFIDAGRVVWQGTGPDILASEHMAHLKTETANSGGDDSTSIGGDPSENRRRSSLIDNAQAFEIKEHPLKTPRQLMMEEHKAKGTVDVSHWRELISFNGGKTFWLVLAALLLGTVAAPVAERGVLEYVQTPSRLDRDRQLTYRFWTGEVTQPGQDGGRVIFWVSLYAGVSIIYGSFHASMLMSSGVYRQHCYQFCFRCMAVLRWPTSHETRKPATYTQDKGLTLQVHSEMLETMLRAKMSFFSRTRAGSIVQRFGKDLVSVSRLKDHRMTTELQNDILSCSELITELAESAIASESRSETSKDMLVALTELSPRGIRLGYLLRRLAVCGYDDRHVCRVIQASTYPNLDRLGATNGSERVVQIGRASGQTLGIDNTGVGQRYLCGDHCWYRCCPGLRFPVNIRQR
jgi:hypothetical protein